HIEEYMSDNSHEEPGENGEKDRNDFVSQSMLAINAPPALDALVQAASPPIAHLNSFLAIHPHLLAKFSTEHVDAELLQNRSLEALQAVINTGNFNMSNMLFGMPSIYNPQQSDLQQQNVQQLTTANLQQQSSQLNNNTPFINTIGNQVPSLVSSSMQPESPASTRSRGSNGESCREIEPREPREPRESRESREPRESREQRPSQNNQQMPNWSYEDQFKQVRQLYEIDENPKRKEFLDELFSYMQNRGTPINRLPIMAKSVLDLFELYNLVVARGGLVEVINKKLWQEIIKGLHLPSSITSAAFTLRSQYMKYLYPYERYKENLSTIDELNAAVESNRREGRRSSYVAFSSNNVNENLQSTIQRNQHGQNSFGLPHSMPLSLAAHMAAAAGGPSSLAANGQHIGMHHRHPPHLPQPNLDSMPQEYMMKVLGQDMRNIISADPSILQRHSSASSPSAEKLIKTDHRINLWNMCHNNNNNSNVLQSAKIHSPHSPPAIHSPLTSTESPEPQREALDLASATIKSELSSSPASVSPLTSNSVTLRKHYNESASSTSFNKRCNEDDDTYIIDRSNLLRVNQSILVRDGGRKQLRMSVDINGIIYKGVLAASNDNNNATSCSSNENDNNATDDIDNKKSSQNISL
ncbi:hypothetical protein HN011_003747, partial [Eciton burchellii]